MDDPEIVRIATRIDRLGQQIRDLCSQIEMSDHPHAEEIIAELARNEIPFYAWARHVIHHHLVTPDRWETGDFGIRRRLKARRDKNG